MQNLKKNSKILYKIEIKIFKTARHWELFQQTKSFPKKNCFKMLFENGEAATYSYT